MSSNVKLLLEELELQTKLWSKELLEWNQTGGPEFGLNKLFNYQRSYKAKTLTKLYNPVASKRKEIEARIIRFSKPIEIPDDIEIVPSELELKSIIFDYKFRIKAIIAAKEELKELPEPKVRSVEDNDKILSLLDQLFHNEIETILFLFEKMNALIRLQKKKESLLIEVFSVDSEIRHNIGSISNLSMKQAGFNVVDNKYEKLLDFSPQYHYEILGQLGFLLIEIFDTEGEFKVIVTDSLPNKG